jgi:orotate phosphoribosyltransferase
MIHSKDMAAKTAADLLQIKAIKLSKTTPFQWASGWQAPIYCDNRKTLSYPDIRNNLLEGFLAIIREHFPDANYIAGVATGGIPLGILVADRLELPFVYVRSAKKEHGLQNQVEGVLNQQAKVVVIEDLISTGKSSLNAVEALQSLGACVLGMAAIFTYGFKIAEENFADQNCKLFTLSDYRHLLPVALEQNYIDEDDLTSLTEWRNNPADWKATS